MAREEVPGVTGQASAVFGQSNKEGSEEVEDVNIHSFTHVIINIRIIYH